MTSGKADGVVASTPGQLLELAVGTLDGRISVPVEFVEALSDVNVFEDLVPYSWRNQRTIDMTGVMPEPAVTNSSLSGTGWGR